MIDEISDARAQPKLHLSVQILSTLLFGVFSITAVAIAFAHFWPAGLVLAVILGWRGGFVPSAPAPYDPEKIVASIRALGPEAHARHARTSGNRSFDAYRADTLSRLEEEQQSFEGFLDRLREARDVHEFDSFLDERANAASDTRAQVFDPVNGEAALAEPRPA